VDGTTLGSFAFGSSVTGPVGCGFNRTNADFDNFCVGSGVAAVSEPLIAPAESADPLPRSYSLEQNYPNPFNAGTNITFSTNTGGDVSLVVYDILGRTVRHLADAFYAEGTHTIAFDGRDEHGASLASGVYLYRLNAPGFNHTRKMVLLK
jgi:hypothetical protein